MCRFFLLVSLIVSYTFYRKYIISCKQTEVPLSVPWDPSNQVLAQLAAYCQCGLTFSTQPHCAKTFFSLMLLPQMYLSYNNVSALKLMDARSNWVLASEKHKVSMITWHVYLIEVTLYHAEWLLPLVQWSCKIQGWPLSCRNTSFLARQS